MVRLSGKTTTKPSSQVYQGSRIVIEQGSVKTTILVEQLAVNRVSFEKAKKFYQIMSKDSEETAIFFKGRGRNRLDKKVRRNLRALKEKLHFLSDN